MAPLEAEPGRSAVSTLPSAALLREGDGSSPNVSTSTPALLVLVNANNLHGNGGSLEGETALRRVDLRTSGRAQKLSFQETPHSCAPLGRQMAPRSKG
jgi:hypothetical protein